MMNENLESILEIALKLPLEQQRQLAERLLEHSKDVLPADVVPALDPAQVSSLELVERTQGTIKGLDRETIIWLAEDEELCGY